MSTKPESIVLVFVATIFNAVGSLFFKIGADMDLARIVSKVLGQNILNTILSIYSDPLIRPLFIVFLGFVMLGFGALTTVLAMRKGELSVVFPLYAANYVWGVLLSWYVLGETIGIIAWTGVSFIVIGVSLIGYGSTILGEDKKNSLERFGIIESNLGRI